MTQADFDTTAMNRDVRDSVMIIQRDRKRKLFFAAAAVVGAVVGLGLLTYVAFNTELDSVKAVDAENQSR